MESPSIRSTGDELSQVENGAENGPDSEERVNETDSMADFYELRNSLLIAVAATSAIIFIAVLLTYGLNIALNYLLGAVVGLVYIRMLAKDVEKIGAGSNRISKVRLALLVGVIAIASKLDSLEILPIFFGFLSYKVALILYTLRAIIQPSSSGT